LDVNEVVHTIEAMYEQVKVDIQANIPDNYISVTDVRARGIATIPPNPNVKPIANAGRSKFEELELKYGHKVTDFLESVAHKEEERLKKLEGGIDSSKARALSVLQDGRNTASRELEEAKIGARDWSRGVEDRGTKMAERELEHARGGVRDWEKDFEEKGTRAAERELEHARSGLLQRGLSFAKDLEQTKKGVLQRSNEMSQTFDAAKASAMQRGQDLEQDVQARTSRLTEAERELEKGVEQTKEATQRAAGSMGQASNSLQRTGESIERVAKAVDDEIQPYRRD
jgi:methyl-accepting chemotaxis protein